MPAERGWPEDLSGLAIDQDSQQSRIAFREGMARGLSGLAIDQDSQQSRLASREKDGQLSRKACREKDGPEETMASSRMISKAGWPANRKAGRER